MRGMYARLFPFAAVYLACSALVTLGLVAWEWPYVSFSFSGLFFSLTGWVWSSAIACLFSLIPYALYLAVLPGRLLGSRFDRVVTFGIFYLFTASQLFKEASALIFWDEFTSRFNFVAVDYLVYTQEVIGNILESYPVAPIFAVIFAAAFLITFLFRQRLVPGKSAESARIPFSRRVGALVGMAAFAAFLNMGFSPNWLEHAGNRYNAELGKDDLYCLFYAFFSNELSYKDFYVTGPEGRNLEILRRAMAGPNISFEGNGLVRNVSNGVRSSGHRESRPNVIIVLMESMGAEFLTENRTDGRVLTPNLDALSEKSLYFSTVYATGTRSVRGIEAVSLSVPPLPGMAIVRREGNDNLFSVGSVFRDKGYETKWIYGGYGYFDNMNAFFEANGFTVKDRTSMSDKEIRFSNVWGVCDEDLFARTIREADASHASGRPFFNILLTTSNHRPFTYPEGRIDIPSKTGRRGGVKYADYAVGEFLRRAREHPWFDNTVFVFLADHGAGSAGKEELQMENHRIPLFIYSPKLVTPRRIDYPVSQLDVVPTLLGILGWNYTGHFYGSDALRPEYEARIFTGNYQKIAYTRGNRTVVLSPVKQCAFYENGKLIEHPGKEYIELLNEAVGYYQYASGWQANLKLPESGDSVISASKKERISDVGRGLGMRREVTRAEEARVM